MSSPFDPSAFIQPVTVMHAREWFSRCDRPVSTCMEYLTHLERAGKVSWLTLDYIARHVFDLYDSPAPAPRPRNAQLSALQWTSELSEYFPQTYIMDRAPELMRLHADGYSPLYAVIYARLHLAAPAELPA